jgi:hypothetical protein
LRIQQVARAGAGPELPGIDFEPGALAGIVALGDAAAILRGNAGPASGRTRARRLADELWIPVADPALGVDDG